MIRILVLFVTLTFAAGCGGSGGGGTATGSTDLPESEAISIATQTIEDREGWSADEITIETDQQGSGWQVVARRSDGTSALVYLDGDGSIVLYERRN